MMSRNGIIVDVTAIVAMTLLAVLGKLPESVTAVVVTMVIAGRFRPPEPAPGSKSKVALPSLPPGSSGLLVVLSSVFESLRR